MSGKVKGNPMFTLGELEFALSVLKAARDDAAVCDELHCNHDDCDINGGDLVDAVNARIDRLQVAIAEKKG